MLRRLHLEVDELSHADHENTLEGCSRTVLNAPRQVSKIISESFWDLKTLCSKSVLPSNAIAISWRSKLISVAHEYSPTKP
jgi:hypothetical protein